jgi:hypothetical protein
VRNRTGAAVVTLLTGAALLVIGASSAVAQAATVRVRISPPTVKAGNSVFITADVTPSTRKSCTATITRPGVTTRLAAKKALGVVSWRWVVPRTAKGGVGVARVACVGAGAGTARFRIIALPPPRPPTIPARVVVTKSGISGRWLEGTGSTFAGYGVVLQNVSPDEDAFDVQVLVNILDGGGRILKSETATYEEIPASATYYGGGDSIFTGTPARLEISVKVGERRKKASVALPQVSNLRVQDFFGRPQVLGEVANTSTSKTLSSLARISFVCLDGAGNVLGGGLAYPPARATSRGSRRVRCSCRGITRRLADRLSAGLGRTRIRLGRKALHDTGGCLSCRQGEPSLPARRATSTPTPKLGLGSFRGWA